MPIKIANKEEQKALIKKVDYIINSNLEIEKINNKFQRIIQRKFELEKLSKKLEDWYLLSFADFVKELKKKNITLSLSEEAEWEDYFLKEQQKAIDLKNEIDQTDNDIDAIVYELYELSLEEI